MENLFIIPAGDKKIPILLTPVARRSAVYNMGQLFFKSGITVESLANVGFTVAYHGYLEYCKSQEITPELTVKEITELLTAHGFDNDTIEAYTNFLRCYVEMEEQEPTIITDQFLQQ